MSAPSFSRALFPAFLLLLMTVCLLVKVRKIWHRWECKRGEEKVRGCSLTPVNTDSGSILPLGCLQQANYQCSVTERDKNTGWLKQIMHRGSTSPLLFFYLKALEHLTLCFWVFLSPHPPKQPGSTKTTGWRVAQEKTRQKEIKAAAE